VQNPYSRQDGNKILYCKEANSIGEQEMNGYIDKLKKQFAR